jgi:hypothetical protein
MRWHNGRTRRSLNPNSENACKGSVTKKDEGAAHPILARSLAPTKAEYICADNVSLSLFACNTAADHTFRVGGDSTTMTALSNFVTALESP